MSRSVFYSKDVCGKTINERFAELNPFWSNDLEKKPPANSDREFQTKKLVEHFHKLSVSELELLTSRDSVPMHWSKIRSTYRNALISEAADCLLNMTDVHLERVYLRLPFSVATHRSATLKRPKSTRSKSKKDERDWDCRPSTIGQVTEKELDRELEDYFLRDPDRFKAMLDAELEEYMSQRWHQPVDDAMEVSDS